MNDKASQGEENPDHLSDSISFSLLVLGASSSATHVIISKMRHHFGHFVEMAIDLRQVLFGKQRDLFLVVVHDWLTDVTIQGISRQVLE